jgi:hypothetical protein
LVLVDIIVGNSLLSREREEEEWSNENRAT